MCIRHGFASNNARAESPKAPSPGQAKRHPGLCAVALSGRAFLVTKPCLNISWILNTLPNGGTHFTKPFIDVKKSR